MDTTPGCNADRYAVERPHRPDILSTSAIVVGFLRGEATSNAFGPNPLSKDLTLPSAS
jgi:hypothetical protein